MVSGYGIQLNGIHQGNDPSGGLNQLSLYADLVRVWYGHAIFGMDGVYAHKAQIRVVESCLAGGGFLISDEVVR